MKRQFFQVLVSIIIFICFCQYLAAQSGSSRFLEIGSAENLTSIQTNCLFQDSRGLLWIGTNGGLDRWDGSHMRNFGYSDSDTLGIPISSVSTIAEDNHNNLWLGSGETGLVKYDLENEKFTHLPNPENRPENFGVLCIKHDPIGFLWLGTRDGLYRFYPTENRYESIYVQDLAFNTAEYISKSAMEFFNAVAMEFDTLGGLWVASNFGLYYLDKMEDVLKPLLFSSPNYADDHFWIRDMSRDMEGMIWMLQGQSEIVRCDPYSKKVEYIWPRKFEKPLNIMGNGGIHVDREGKVWFGIGDVQLKQYDPLTGKIRSLGEQGKAPITDLLEDFDGNIIVAHLEGIKILIEKRDVHIKHFSREMIADSEMGQAYLTDILRDGQTYWIGMRMGGLVKLNTEPGNRVVYRPSESPRSLDESVVMRIIKDRSNKIWIKTGTCLNLYDPEKDNFKRFPLNVRPYNFRAPIMEDTVGNFWIVGIDGLLRFNPVNYDTLRFPVNKPFTDNIGWGWQDRYGFFQDTAGFFWIAGKDFGGLIRIDPKTGNWINYQFDINNPLGLPASIINTILYDSRNRIWAGTDEGLSNIVTIPESDSILCKNYYVKNGLIGNKILSLAEDKLGNIWVGTTVGISVIKTDGTIQNLTNKDGLSDIPFIYLLKSDPEGYIYAGMFDFVEIPPDFFQPNENIPPVLLTDFKIFGESILPGEKSPLKKSILFADQIDLNYKENFIRIEFSALNHKHSEKNRYRYILHGIDRDTSNVLERNYAEYTDLKPGKYTFWATGSNNTGIWNENGAQLMVNIHPPPWATWWAYIGYGILMLLGIWGFIAWRTQEHKRKLKELEKVNTRLRQVDQLKDQFLANTSHELRTPLQGIIGLAESLIDGVAGKPTKNMKSNLGMLVSSAKRLTNLVNSILDFSKIKADELKLNIKDVDLRTICGVVLKMNQNLITGKSIELINEIPPDIPLVKADEERVYQILNNLIGNATKFTEEGAVSIEAVQKEENILVQVIDTGIGIPGDKLDDVFKSFEQVDASETREYGGTGLGLTVTKQLIELQGGNIWIESEPGKGTTVNFTLPKSESTKTIIKESDELQRMKPDLVEEEEMLAEEIESAIQETVQFKILIVDDEPVNQQVLSNHLASGNYKVFQALNGREALEIMQKETFDLVLLDIMMPKMSGYEVCQEIRKQYMPNELPVIMVTAKDQVSDLVQGLASGANDYLAKPFSKDEFLARVKTHLNLYKINSSYLRFVPAEFLRTLGRDSIIDVELGDQVEGDMTVLFTDIRSFTSITEKLSAKESFEFLNEYLNQITPSILSNRGFIDKYIGDAIMALFPYSAEDSLKAGIQLMENLRQYNTERKAKGQASIQIGVGIHTGPLMMGTIGVESRMDGTVISDAVNLASRIEGLTKVYGATLIISQETIDNLEDSGKYHFRSLGEVKVKGKEISTKIFECFDVDEQEIIQKKVDTLKEFETALGHYYKKEFLEASKIFNQIVKNNNADHAAIYYYKLSEQFSNRGVDEKWSAADLIDNI